MHFLVRPIIFSVCSVCLLCFSTELVGQNNYTQKQALEELEIIRNAIVKYHPFPFRYISEESWNKHFSQIQTSIQEADSINMFEFMALASPLISLLRDEHSNLYPKENTLKNLGLSARLFPFEVSLTADSTFIIRKITSPTIDSKYVGKEISHINRRSTHEIIKKLTLCGGTSASSDYAGTLYHAFNYDNFSRLYFLCVDQSEAFDVQFITGEQQVFYGHKSQDAINSVYKLNPETSPVFHIAKDSSFAYLSVSSFWPLAYDSSLKKVLKETDTYFQQLKELSISKMVIDVRGNRGGTPFYSTYLASYFFKQPFQPFEKVTAKKQAALAFSKQFKGVRKPLFDPKTDTVTLPKRLKEFATNHHEDLIFHGEAIVLIDAGTGSAASIFAGLMSHYKNVTFLGNETLGDAHKTTGGQFKVFDLPYSNLELTIPLLMFHHGSSERSYGIKPDSPFIDESLLLGASSEG